MKTVESQFHVHSLHSYFVLAGDDAVPIVYSVQRIRDGKSYVTRHVTAKQKGKIIFTCMVSFATYERSPLEHQLEMPVVPLPETIRSMEERLTSWLQDPRLPQKFHKSIKMRLEQPIPIDLRRINSKKIGLQGEPKQMVWMKAKGALPNDCAFHNCVLAYCSDHYLLNTSVLKHQLKPGQLKMIASLDHAIWFHEPFRADEWLLYEMESTKTINGRGLAFGRIWTQQGRCVASTAQEGVLRVEMTKL